MMGKDFIPKAQQTKKTQQALAKLAKRKPAVQNKSGVIVTEKPDGFDVICSNLLDLMDLVRRNGGQLRG